MAIARNRQDRLADGNIDLGEDLANIAADHHLDQLILVHIGNQPLADHAAIAKHGIAVGDAEDLIELVADEQDRLAIRLQPVDQLIELVDFLVRQGRRRLVHDDDAGIDRQGAGNRHHMLVRNAEIAQPDGRIDVCADAGEQVSGIIVEFRPVDEAETAAWCVAEKDVFSDRQFVEQHRFLMNGGDPGMGRRQGGGEMGFLCQRHGSCRRPAGRYR